MDEVKKDTFFNNISIDEKVLLNEAKKTDRLLAGCLKIVLTGRGGSPI